MAMQQSYNLDGLHITFGDRVRRLRTVLGMTQNQFGETLAYSGAAVARWEKMDHDPRSARRIVAAVRMVYGEQAERFLTSGDEPTDKGAPEAA